ncbi:hypothetical protein SASPL_122996 [Salvia splendens]|uniref:Uncharacterized protein n=1 Tax=Salvia splendens TaxID=180675 RepID=A0A8X8XKX5_SALSN|nr:hypothetical protein SASPL_122996 [Salvia splendens]
MKNFNNEATAGPFLCTFGIKGKRGLKKLLEKEMWWYYDQFGAGALSEEQMPHFGARVGFRSKSLKNEKVVEKVASGMPLRRAVMMLDALEQAASSQLYNVLSTLTDAKRLEEGCGFKNGVVKASADWGAVWKKVEAAGAIVELDWSKFDRERPAEDIAFIIDVVISCFEARDERGKRLLEAYKLMMTKAVIERVVVLDDGGVFTIDAGIPPSGFKTMCAGDDNLTIFSHEDFIIHRGSYHVTRLQACFPPGTNMKEGTSKLMHMVRWDEFDGELIIDEAAGRSHRWEYNFKGKPKFLSNFWLIDGQPIRPTHDNLEKLLWPEGIHDSLDVYGAAVMAMVVDNPWNHHCVNHMLMRYVIIQQLRRIDLIKGATHDVMIMCGLREAGGGGEVPFPMVAPWRRGNVHCRMEDYPEVAIYINEFSAFFRGVTTLYSRMPTGGIDAWAFMNIIRGESHVGEGQYGNDLIEWLKFLSKKYLRNLRGFRDRPAPVEPSEGDEQAFLSGFEVYRDLLLRRRLRTPMEFGAFLSRSPRNLLEMQLPVNDELVWHNGTPFPEPCIDRIADAVGKIVNIDYLQLKTTLRSVLENDPELGVLMLS